MKLAGETMGRCELKSGGSCWFQVLAVKNGIVTSSRTRNGTLRVSRSTASRTHVAVRCGISECGQCHEWTRRTDCRSRGVRRGPFVWARWCAVWHCWCCGSQHLSESVRRRQNLNKKKRCERNSETISTWNLSDHESKNELGSSLLKSATKLVSVHYVSFTKTRFWTKTKFLSNQNGPRHCALCSGIVWPIEFKDLPINGYTLKCISVKRLCSEYPSLFLSYFRCQCAPNRSQNWPSFDHCFALVQWTESSVLHLRISSFCKQKVTFLILGLDSSCLIEHKRVNDKRSETTQMMKWWIDCKGV
jgi:hypothetical protein